MLNLNSLAASPCVISFFLVFFNATSRSLSTWVISSCPSCIPKAWGCQDDISTLLKDDILTLLPQQYLRVLDFFELVYGIPKLHIVRRRTFWPATTPNAAHHNPPCRSFTTR